MKYVMILWIASLVNLASSVSVTILENSCGTSGVQLGPVLDVFTDITDLRCSRMCRDNLECQFVNYHPGTVTSPSTCTLLNGDASCSEIGSSGISHYQLSARIPQDWSYFSGSIYFVTPDTYTYQQCVDICGDLQANLTAITSTEEDEFIMTYLNLDRDLWLSGNDIALEGQWVWGNGEVLGYTNWVVQGGQPDNYQVENCMMMGKSSTFPLWEGWNDDDCTQHYHCTCEKHM